VFSNCTLYSSIEPNVSNNPDRVLLLTIYSYRSATMAVGRNDEIGVRFGDVRVIDCELEELTEQERSKVFYRKDQLAELFKSDLLYHESFDEGSDISDSEICWRGLEHHQSIDIINRLEKVSAHVGHILGIQRDINHFNFLTPQQRSELLRTECRGQSKSDRKEARKLALQDKRDAQQNVLTLRDYKQLQKLAKAYSESNNDRFLLTARHQDTGRTLKGAVKQKPQELRFDFDWVRISRRGI